MPETSKIFTYEQEGLAYTVTVYETEDGTFQADIHVTEGAMDVNAIYIGDDDFSGDSVSLDGPLNMNGARLEGEDLQWDDATMLSDPGLGPEGEDKDTYVSTGDTLTVELDVDSLDEIDIFGIRATSTTTEEGSIKAVSDDPEEPEEPEEEPTFEKLGFGYEIGDNGIISNGVYYSESDLPEGEEATFENYVNHFEASGGEIEELDATIFYEMVQTNTGLEYPSEFFRIEAPEGGYQSSDELLADFDQAVEDGVFDDVGSTGDEGLDLIAALSIDEPVEETPVIEEEPVAEEFLDLI